MSKKIDILPGTRFNKLTYLYDTKRKNNTRQAMFLCDCGKQKEMTVGNVRQGRSTSCGCEQFTLQTKHGQAKQEKHTVLYNRWKGMKQRCNNPNFKHYHRYGGRGITVCTAWEEFMPFYLWATQNGFSKELTLDRINNDKGYSPVNCRWVDRAIQSANVNKKRHVRYKYIGVNQLPSKKWRAQIRSQNKQIHIGVYLTEIEAVQARDTYIKNNKLPHKLNLN